MRFTYSGGLPTSWMRHGCQTGCLSGGTGARSSTSYLCLPRPRSHILMRFMHRMLHDCIVTFFSLTFFSVSIECSTFTDCCMPTNCRWILGPTVGFRQVPYYCFFFSFIALFVCAFMLYRSFDINLLGDQSACPFLFCPSPPVTTPLVSYPNHPIFLSAYRHISISYPL